MVKTYDPTKLQARLHGPYTIVACQTNGTVVVKRDPQGFILETYNIRKLEPYKGPQQIALFNDMNKRRKQRKRQGNRY